MKFGVLQFLDKILDISIRFQKILDISIGFQNSKGIRTFSVQQGLDRTRLNGYITNITNKSEVQMDLLLILALSLSFWAMLLVLQSMATIIHRSKSVRKRFDK